MVFTTLNYNCVLDAIIYKFLCLFFFFGSFFHRASNLFCKNYLEDNINFLKNFHGIEKYSSILYLRKKLMLIWITLQAKQTRNYKETILRNENKHNFYL